MIWLIMGLNYYTFMDNNINLIKKMNKEITIGELHEIYQKYGDLGFKVNTPYGFKDIEWCGITEKNADIYRCELENGMYVEGADYHKLKHENNEFIHLKEAEVGQPIQTIDGISNIKSIELMNFKDTLYDIQVSEVHQYYSNGIVSHNTTLTIDAIKFLLHGTTTKTDKNEEVFNLYTKKNELTVRGMIDIEGEETIIERKMRRSAKKDGGWTVTNKLNYYKLLPDGTEELQNEEDAKESTKKLRETIGTEKDFEMLVLATEKNLDDLIGLTTTESGKILTRLIGLEILELKESVVRGMYNEFSKKKKSNSYDIITLGGEIIENKEKIILNTELKTILEKTLSDTIKEIADLNIENDRLLNSKENIDVTIFELNPSKLEGDIADLKLKGVGLKEKKMAIEEKITNIGKIDFDEDKHYLLTKDLNKQITDKALKENDINRLKKVISGLISGGICQSCNRKLDDVDNSEHITKHELEIKKLNDEIIIVDDNIKTIGNEIDILNKTKVLVDEKNKLELDKDRAEVEIGFLRNSFSSKTNDLKKYNLNLEAIELNRKIDSEVAKVKTDIKVGDVTKTETMSKLNRISSDIELNLTNIDTKEKLIDVIKKEDEVDKIYKTYIDLVGKKGISKLVLRSVLPIINSEVQRLLEDVCDFDVEVYMDDKNEVQFLMYKDDIPKRLKAGSGFEKTAASLALRCVLGKMSTLPMPNFITFDEVLGISSLYIKN